MLLALCACGPDDGGGTDGALTGSTGSTDTDPTETSGDPVDPACSCIAADDCGAPLCQPVGLDCDESCLNHQSVTGEDWLKCALEALRDRTPGRIGWYTSTYGGQFSDRSDVYIQTSGEAVVRRSGDADLCSYTGPDSIHILAEPAHFAGCLDLVIGRERFDCMTEGLLEQRVACVLEEDHCGGA
ncbi:hypothetical protein [Nannocystis pusilla]|uniref:Lipoprotein n=1 Tax=Nannocystis pusilla TaxID=889268 RepID=A0ABS7TKP9_9BACT|nr:hypothetical protein [Nannocystis pusilla]MBZ5708799.1 hypothetical protein [Nannocystis pusilla]